MRTGRVDESYESFCKGLDVLGVNWPREKRQVGLGILKGMGAQAMRRIRGLKPDQNAPVGEREMILADGLEQFSYLFFFAQRFDEMFLTNVLSLNYAEKANTAPGVKKRLVQMAANLSIGGAIGPSNYYMRKAAEISGENSTDGDIAYAHLYRGLSYCGQARYEECIPSLLEGIELAQKLGNKRLELDLRAFYSHTQFELSDVESALKLKQDYLADALASEDQAQHQCFAVYNVGQVRYRMGDLQGARADFITARERLMPNYDLDRLLVLGTLSLVELQLQNHQAAWDLATESLELAERAPPTGFYLADAFSNVASVFLEFHAMQNPPIQIDKAEALALAGRALKVFGTVAKKFASNRPRYLVVNGRYLATVGKIKKATVSAQQGIDLAQELGLKFEHAHGHLLVGRFPHLDADARSSHLTQARNGFAAIGLDTWVRGNRKRANARLIKPGGALFFLRSGAWRQRFRIFADNILRKA